MLKVIFSFCLWFTFKQLTPPVLQVLEETAKMLKRHKQRFLGDLHVDQQKLRAQLEVLRSDVEAFADLGDITQVNSSCISDARSSLMQ